MVSLFFDWEESLGYPRPTKADLLISYDEYELIMRALKTYAVEVNVFSELSEVVSLVNNLEGWLKNARATYEKGSELKLFMISYTARGISPPWQFGTLFA